MRITRATRLWLTRSVSATTSFSVITYLPLATGGNLNLATVIGCCSRMGADVTTYLKAVHTVGTPLELDLNWRTDAALLQTLHHLYGGAAPRR